MQLYQLPDAFNAIQYAITQNDGELTTFLAEALDAIESDLSKQIEFLVKMRANLLSEEKSLRMESGRLLIGARDRAESVDVIEKRVVDTLYRLPVDYVSTSIGKVRSQRNSRPSITFEGDPATLPDQYRKVKYEANTEHAYSVWKHGGPLPEGFVVREGHHIRIV